MNDFPIQKITAEAAYESFNDLEEFHIFFDRNGLAYERIFDDGLNEITVLFSDVSKTRYFHSALREYPESYTCYEKGLKHGSAFEWWPNGKLRSQELFIKGHSMGGNTRWNIDGTLKTQSEPDEQLIDEALKNGQRNGDYFEWWPNGKLRVFRTYVDGKEHGISCIWHYNGVLAYEGGRREGIVDGISRAWDEDGFQTSETCWDRGKSCGYRILWYRPSREVEYLYYEGKAGIFDFFDRPDQSPHFTFIRKWLKQ
jgi:antitoxin component YwqK of YwqJK toxin-antitoxin module